MSGKTINIEPIGLVSFKVNERSARLRISIKPDGSVVVSMPPSATFRDATAFVESKIGWISEHKTKIQIKSSVFSPASNFHTKFHRLVIVKTGTTKIYNRVGNGTIQIFIPERANHELPVIQEFIRKTIVAVMRWEAKIYLPKRLAELAAKHGFSYNNVSIKNTSTRWGSCSSANNINLNLHLMRLPDHLIDYVLLHELTHTAVKNHGEKFWLLLDHCLPGARKTDKEMNKYRTQVF